jgi:hypothetical protein
MWLEGLMAEFRDRLRYSQMPQYENNEGYKWGAMQAMQSCVSPPTCAEQVPTQINVISQPCIDGAETAIMVQQIPVFFVQPDGEVAKD